MTVMFILRIEKLVSEGLSAMINTGQTVPFYDRLTLSIGTNGTRCNEVMG